MQKKSDYDLLREAVPDDFNGFAWVNAYIRDESDPIYDVYTWPAPAPPNRPDYHPDVERVKTALLVEAWLAVECLSALDVRPLLPDRDDKTQRLTGRDYRTKGQRRNDAVELVTNIIGAQRWETAKSKGRQQVDSWYNAKSTKLVNKYMRNEKIQNIRLSNPHAGDVDIAKKHLENIRILAIADYGMDLLSELLSHFRSGSASKAQKSRKRRSKPEFFSIERLYSLEVLAKASYLTGVNLGAILGAQEFIEHFLTMAIFGKYYRDTPLTPMEKCHFDGYVVPLLSGARPPSSPSEVETLKYFILLVSTTAFVPPHAEAPSLRDYLDK